MAQKYALGSQAAGFISFRKPITDASTYSGSTTYSLVIPDGMISVGDNGRGFVVNAQTVEISSISAAAEDTYVLYASAPTGSDPAGLAIVESAVQSFSTYTSGGTRVYEGDDAGRRAIAIFRTRIDIDDGNKYKIDPSSIQTLTSFDYKTLTAFVQEHGLYTSKNDPDFEYRGQNVDIDAVIDEGTVSNNNVVYWDGSKYVQAQGDDSSNLQISENVIGIAKKNRDGVKGKHAVISSGFVEVGEDTTGIPNSVFPVNTKIFLSDVIAGGYAREFDTHPGTIATAYALGDQVIARSTGAGNKWFVFENFELTGGTSGGVATDTVFASISDIWNPGDTTGATNSVTDGTVEWRAVAEFKSEYQSNTRKIQLGISLGNGIMLLQPGGGASSIDDHDEASNAHPDMRTAINKAGIYVYDSASQLEGATAFNYRGQYFDEKATFLSGDSIVDGDVVALDYSVDTTLVDTYQRYRKAKFDNSTASNAKLKFVVGIADRVSGGSTGYVVSSGYVDFDTSNILVGSQGSAAEGSEVFLSSTAGTLTLDRTDVKVGHIVALNDSTYTPPATPTADTTGKPGTLCIDIEIDYRNQLEKYGIYLDSDVTGTHDYVGQTNDFNASFNASVTADGEVVYFDGTDYKLAQDDAGSTDKETWIGIAKAVYPPGVTTTTPNVLVTNGFVKIPGATWTAGESIYLSTSAAGGLSNVITNGERILVGVAVDTDVVFLMRGNATINVTADSKNDNVALTDATIEAGIATGDHRVVYCADNAGAGVYTRADINQASGNQVETQPVGITYKADGTGNKATIVTKGFMIVPTTDVMFRDPADNGVSQLAPSAAGQKLYLCDNGSFLGTTLVVDADTIDANLPAGEYIIGRIINVSGGNATVYIDIEKDTFTKNQIETLAESSAIAMAIALG